MSALIAAFFKSDSGSLNIRRFSLIWSLVPHFSGISSFYVLAPEFRSILCEV